MVPRNSVEVSDITHKQFILFYAAHFFTILSLIFSGQTNRGRAIISSSAATVDFSALLIFSDRPLWFKAAISLK
jgi:hypothetical protein